MEKSTKICGIICEYNPFHNGHKYHIEQTKEKFGATHIVAVMSGSFTQRGDAAIVDKWKRAETALRNGVDLVIELPVAFAMAGAEQFAFGAVHILEKMGCVALLSFGSESGNIELLKETAGAVHYALDSEDFLSLMRMGNSYPVALQKTIEKFYTDEVIETLATPNNTLAIEYLKAINECGSFIEPVTVKRFGAAHDSDKAVGGYAGASEIRKRILSGGDYSALIPEGGDFSETAELSRLERAILAQIRGMSAAEIERIAGVSLGLENRIHQAARLARTTNELLFLIKTKRYTLARLRRILLSCFLGITKNDLKNPPPYGRIIGMNSRGREILKLSSPDFPLDTSLSALSKKSPDAKAAARLEAHAGDLYALAFEKPRPCGLDFTHKPIIIE